MRRDKESLENKQDGVERRIEAVRADHDEIVKEMRVFTQRKNDQLLDEAHGVSDQLDKKRKELQLILNVGLMSELEPARRGLRDGAEVLQ